MEDTVEAKMSKLRLIQEELKKGKESAMQSWLDSRPLIDELEKLQSQLATARNRTSMSNIVISELESQLEATNSAIKSRVEEELKVTKMANEMTQDLDGRRDEMEMIKQESDEARRTRAKLKQVVRMRRQTLRTSQLTIRAIRIDSEAFAASAAEAQRYITISETEYNNNVQLSQHEYFALKQRAKDEMALAEWRISVSMEQKLAAEASRNLAISRLKDVSTDSKRRKPKEERSIQEEDRSGPAFPEAQAETVTNSNWRKPHSRRSRSKAKCKQKLVKKKKSSFLSQLKKFLPCWG